MCRAHRAFVAAAATIWGVLLALIAVAPKDGNWKMATILTGCLAVTMLPFSALPWLVTSMLKGQRKDLEELLHDIGGAYIAGWEAGQAGDEPTEPVRQLHAVR